MSDEDDEPDYGEIDEDDVDDDEPPEPEVTIEISGLSLFTHLGVTAAEREVGQRGRRVAVSRVGAGGRAHWTSFPL